MSNADQPLPALAPAKKPKLATITSHRRRRSVIAGFPKATRDQINQMFDDGHSCPAIRDLLAPQRIFVTDDSLERWRRGGYQDHLHELHLLEESRQRFELTLGLAKDEQGIDVFQAAHKIAAALICEAVAEVGADSLRQAVKVNPLNLLRMLNTLSRLTAGGLKCERHLADTAERLAALSEPNLKPDDEKGLSPSSVKEMEDALHLM